MEKLTMCRVCLMQNVRMCVVSDIHLQEVYERLTNIPFMTKDSKPMLACSYCYARLKQCYVFLTKCLQAEELLSQMLTEDYERNSVKIQEDIFGGFITTSIQHLSIIDICPPDGSTVKEELSANCDKTYGVVLKDEPQSDGLHPEAAHAYLEDENQSQTDSEDDIPLTKIKIEIKGVEKTLKKERVKKRKHGRNINASEIVLTKEQQLENLQARSKSSNYTNSPFKCGLCYKGFIDMRAYCNHKMKHDSRSGAHVCDICRMHYRTAQHLRTHTVTAHARIFKCNKCGHVSQTANQARIHEKWHKGHTYECQLCSHTFRKPTSYFSHMRKRHPTEHVCNICGESFVGKHGLKMHKRLTHINDEKVEEPDPDSTASDRFCVECNIQFVSLEAWKRHILRSIKHTLKNEQSNHCSICPWRFSGNVSLATHMQEHAKNLRKSKKQTLVNSDRQLRCPQCGSNFANVSKLQAHIKRTHLGLKYNKNIVCEVCGKKCTSNATLKYHQRTHTGEKPYSCASCSKHFSDNNQLRIHTRTHTGEKPYICTVCGKRFTQKPALNRHYRVHTGVKPYTCQYCSRTFSQSNSLKLHVKTVHLKQPANSRKKTLNTSQDIKITEKNEQELQTVALALN